MEIKSIEQIKDEYATLVCIYPSWEELLNDIPSHEIESHTDEVAEHYAQQFQHPTDVLTTEIMVLRERNAEMLEMLEECRSVIEWYMDNARPDNNHEDFFNIGANQIEQIEQLITKAK